MRQIAKYLKYDGGPIQAHCLYTGTEKFKLNGQIEFQIFGSAKLNGHTIKDTNIRTQADDDILVLGKDSAVVFHKTPKNVETPEGYEPVPDIPDYMDEATASIAGMVEEVLRRRGLLAEGERSVLPEFDEQEFEDDEYDVRIPLSEATLLPNPNTDDKNDEIQSGQVVDSDLQQSTEVSPEVESVSDVNSEDTGMRDRVSDPVEMQQNSTS
jgi:hypothetical protein